MTRNYIAPLFSHRQIELAWQRLHDASYSKRHRRVSDTRTDDVHNKGTAVARRLQLMHAAGVNVAGQNGDRTRQCCGHVKEQLQEKQLLCQVRRARPMVVHVVQQLRFAERSVPAKLQQNAWLAAKGCCKIRSNSLLQALVQ